MNHYLTKLLKGDHLPYPESYDLFADPQLSREQHAAILALLSAKKETPEELLGVLDYFSQYAPPIECPFDIVDIVGTGGDGIGTFNVSTAASLVTASCGAYVAKHGGRSSTSRSGSMDVMEALKLQYAKNDQDVLRSLKSHRYAYLWAPLFNPEFRKFADLRGKLKFSTLFNILGPLLNPMRPRRQVIGVYRKDLVSKVAQVLRSQGVVHAMVIHSHDGMDELSCSAPSLIAEIKNGIIHEYIFHPKEVGIRMSNIHEVIGGNPFDNARIIEGIFKGSTQGPKLDIVCLNSAAALYVAGMAKDLKEGLILAYHGISSGKTASLLEQLRERG